MDKKAVREKKEYIILFTVIVGVYIGFQYFSPLVTPFLFAFLFVSKLHPWLEKMQERYHIKKSFLTAGVLLLLCLIVGMSIWGLLIFIFRIMSGMFGQIDIFEQKFCLFWGDCCDGLKQRFGMNGDKIETFVVEKVNIFIENFQIEVVPKIMNQSVGYMKNIAGIVSFLAIMIIAAVLLAKDYKEIMKKLYGRREYKPIMDVGKRVLHHIGTFIKAQLTILFIISALCSVTLFLAGIKGGIVIGLFTGFMDLLPFIGTGMVLLPLAFWQVLNGYYAKAVVCVILYVICALTREFLEPKLVGERMGIFPVAILFAVYAGVKLFGIFGIIKGPLALIVIYEVYVYLKQKREKERNKEPGSVYS